MCTGLKYGDCMGRNFDYDVSYDEELRVVSPQSYGNKYKVVGMCTGLIKDYPLLYDGMNECGLCGCGLAFEGNAEYNDNVSGKVNVPAYDFLFTILGSYDSVESLLDDIDDFNITDEQYSERFPNSDLHWFVCDVYDSVVIEQTIDGLEYYIADTDVLTNNPPYQLQLSLFKIMKQFIGRDYGEMESYYKSRGRETDNLSGGYSSNERFERVSYLLDLLNKSSSPCDDVTETFHLLSSVEQVYGVTPVNDGFEYTLYSIVYDMYRKEVHWKSYGSTEMNFISL